MPNDTGSPSMTLPAICPNGHAFIASGMVVEGLGASVRFRGLVVSCPYCGARAAIPDGEYSLEQRAGEVITVLRTLSRDQVWEIRAALQQAKQAPTDENVQAAIDALPDTIREIVRRENKLPVRLAILSLILALILGVFPHLPQDAESAVKDVISSPSASRPVDEPHTPAELEQIVQQAVHEYQEQLWADQEKSVPVNPSSNATKPGPTPGRNSPCPCGSGKKFKYCHGR